MMQPNRLRFFHTIVHIPFAQLRRRLTLILKRQFMVCVAKHLPAISKQKALRVPQREAHVPIPLFPTLSQSCVSFRSTGWRFTFLNVARDLGRPVQWDHPEINVGTRLWKLHLHYFDWAASLSDSDFIELVDDWIQHNPPYAEGYWLDSWNSYAISIRVVAWMTELERRSSHLGELFLHRVAESLYRQLRFLKRNIELDIGGNHLVKNIKALYWGSRFFSGGSARKMASRAQRLLWKQLDDQILEDGFHFELSPAYHMQVFIDLLDVFRLVDDARLRDRMRDILRNMAQVVADMTHPDGSLAMFNDGGATMVPPVTKAVDAYRRVTELPAPVARQRGCFDKAGYYFFHAANYVIFYDAGKVGPDSLPAHSHGDIFSYELSVDGHRFIVDPGVYEYNPGVRRMLSRSTGMHNTVTVDNADQCEFWGAFRMARRASVSINHVGLSSESLVVEASHNGYRRLDGRPRHRRHIEALWSDRVTVKDEVQGGSGQHAASRVLLHPEVIVDHVESFRVRLARGDKNVELVTDQVPIRIESTVYWPDFGREEETNMIVMDLGPVPTCRSYQLNVIGA